MLTTSPRDSGVCERAHEAVHRVLDVGEAPRLQAVAVDLRGFAVEQRFDEGHRRAAPPGQVVARAVDVEEAQDRHLQAALVGERERVVLVVHLRDRIRPALGGRRPDHELAVLAVGRRAVPVHVGRRRHDHVCVERERDRAGRVHAGHVDLERRQRAAVARDLLRREVHDRVAAFERRPQRSPLRAVEHLEREAAMLEERLQVRHRAVGEVVDSDDLVVLVQQSFAEVRADEPGRTGDSDLGHVTPVMPPPFREPGADRGSREQPGSRRP